MTGQRRTVMGKTMGEASSRAEAKAAELSAALSGGPLGSAPTIRDLTRYYLTTVAPLRVQAGTLATYRTQCERLDELFGDVGLAAIDVATVQKMLAGLAETYSANTVRGFRTRLGTLCDVAVDVGVMGSNPVRRVKAPKPNTIPSKPRRWLSVDEIHRLVTAAEDHRLGAAVAWLFLKGNRASEVLGIGWDDIDFGVDPPTAIIRRGSTYAKGVGQHLHPPKNKSTSGVIDLPPSLVSLLRDREAAQQVERSEAGELWRTIEYEGAPVRLVFTTTDGRPVLSQKLHKAVRECCALAGVDPSSVGTHTGRRSAITNLFQSGEHIDDIARLVGHSSPSTTAGYVTDLGKRPEDVSRRSASLLDPTASP